MAPSASTLDALAAFHRRHGARPGTYRGIEAPADFGDPIAELAAVREGAGLVPRPWAETLELRGEDRRRYLNGLVTCDVTGIEPGCGTYGYFTQVKGRILADAAILALEDRLWLELSPGGGGEIERHLGKYLIADRVEIGAPLAGLLVSVVGPAVGAVLEAELPEEPWQHRSLELAGVEVRAAREPDLGVPSMALWIPGEGAEAVADALCARGAGPAGYRAYDALRVTAGRPLCGVDYGTDNFPQETGLDDAVSYTKGCYLGQEVVARIHYRGGVQRRLRGLVFDQEVADPVGCTVVHDGREAGRVTSAVAPPLSERTLGLAILHRRVEVGAEVEIEDAGSARVVEAGAGWGG